MAIQFEIKETRYVGMLKCRKCGKDLNYNEELHPQGEIDCHECNESQPYRRENNNEINITIESLDSHCTIEAFLAIDHKTKSFIPEPVESSTGCEFTDFRDIAKEFLRKKGRELEQEDFWKGYRFVDDFSTM